MSSSTKGKITFRIAAVLFLLSALLEIFFITSKATLFGEARGGAVAVIYHLIYFSLFFGLGIGLWRAKLWGYKLVFVATFFYTLDKAQYLLFRKSLEVDLGQQLSRYEDLVQRIDMGVIIQVVILLTLVFAACWWGFAFYTYLRRDYFRPRQQPQTPPASNQTDT